ncbi:MAG: nucleotidyltransferase family protein [Acidimicrobiales bacterium]
MTVAGVILAAGSGSRYLEGGGSQLSVHKLTAPFRGRPLLSWALAAADEAGFNQLYVITGAVDVDQLIAETLGERATVLRNPHWADGQATSLALAVEAAIADEHRAIVVGLADQPLVPASAWRSVGASAGEIVTATFGGVRRPPVKLERSVWADLPHSGDEGARSLFRLRPELVSELPCSGNPVDIDTLEDLQQWS